MPNYPNFTGAIPGSSQNYYSMVNSPTIPQPTRPATPTTIVVPVSSADAAKAYPVAPGVTVLLMNYPGREFWVKTTGVDGFTQTMISHKFLVESDSSRATTEQFVSREEFEALKKQFEEFIK